MRLIDADALKKSIPTTKVDIFENCRYCSLLDDEQIKRIIDEAPSIDAVQYTDDEIQRMQDIEQAQIQKAYDLGYAEGKADAVPVVRCKDCKHRPKRLEEGKGEGFNLEFPDDNFKCPCQCDDGWYNWMPDDHWFCADGERKES